MCRNFLTGWLVTLALTIAGLVRSPRGEVGLSGVLIDQTKRVAKAYQNCFDDVNIEVQDSSWR